MREQFLETSRKNLAIFLRERDPKNAKDLADLAETNLAVLPDAQVNKQNKQVKAAPAKIPAQGTTTVQGTNGSKKCFKCNQVGHIAKDCLSKIKPWMKAIASAIAEDVQVKVKEQGSENTVTRSSVCVVHSCEHECVSPDNIKLACANHLPIISGACDQQEARQSILKNMPVVKGEVGLSVVNVLRDTG